MKFATVWKRASSDDRRAESAFIPNPSWNDGSADSFYVYILKLERSGIYVGQTCELRQRMLEHKEGKALTCIVLSAPPKEPVALPQLSCDKNH